MSSTDQPDRANLSATGGAGCTDSDSTDAARHNAMVGQFFRYLRSERGLAENTIAAYESDLRQWQGSLGGRLFPIDRRTVTRIIANLVESSVSARSIARHVSTLKALYRYLLRRRVVTSDPLRNVPTPKFEKALPMPPSREEIGRMLSSINRNTVQGKRDYALLSLLESAGLRVSEAVHLDVADLHLADHYVSVRCGKGEKDRDAPLDQPACDALRDYLEGGRAEPRKKVSISTRLFPITRVRAYQIVSNIAARAVGRPVHPHELRHAFGTHLVKHGVELRDVADLMGHASVDTTQVYLGLDLESLEETFYRCHPRGRIRHEGS